MLATKTHIPTLRGTLVKRPHLIQRLNDGIAQNCRLTLVSAPAGFGKTTLLSEGIVSWGSRARVAWVSLDEGDDDVVRFWSYTMAALQTLEPAIGQTALGALQDAQAQLPPRSTSWIQSMPSIFEEVAWRGVILALFLRFYDQPKAILFSALGFGLMHTLTLQGGRPPVWTAGAVVWAAILGLFYGYVTIKTGSLLPAMIVHYLGNLFIAAINAYIQNNASVPVQAVYGVVFSLGIIPTVLMLTLDAPLHHLVAYDP